MVDEAERLRNISKYYDELTDGYDEGYSNEVCRAEDSVVLDIIRPYLRGKILDIGAGSGLLCDLVNLPGYHGIEISHKMTSEAKAKHPDKHVAVADMHSLPFPDNFFDSAVSLYGPISYSLTPEDLLSEIRRVVVPGGNIMLMPYTLRVGHKIEIGGYSTATEDSIQKIYYTQEQLVELLSPLEGVHVMGINYFLNTFTRFSQIMGLGNDHTAEQLTLFLEKEKSMREILPAEFARHMIGIGKNPV
jgi:ubiquinone/menaquinone biosynthesis C-methylase UbiE